jgi:hypothetical protein
MVISPLRTQTLDMVSKDTRWEIIELKWEEVGCALRRNAVESVGQMDVQETLRRSLTRLGGQTEYRLNSVTEWLDPVTIWLTPVTI